MLRLGGGFSVGGSSKAIKMIEELVAKLIVKVDLCIAKVST